MERHITHSPDAFSSLRSCEGAGDADVMFHSGLRSLTSFSTSIFFRCNSQVVLGWPAVIHPLGVGSPLVRAGRAASAHTGT